MTRPFREISTWSPDRSDSPSRFLFEKEVIHGPNVQQFRFTIYLNQSTTRMKWQTPRLERGVCSQPGGVVLPSACCTRIVRQPASPRKYEEHSYVQHDRTDFSRCAGSARPHIAGLSLDRRCLPTLRSNPYAWRRRARRRSLPTIESPKRSLHYSSPARARWLYPGRSAGQEAS
jgi:hypothetical protein